MKKKNCTTWAEFTIDLVNDLIGTFPESSPKTAVSARRMKKAYYKHFAESGLSQDRLASAYYDCVHYMGMQQAPSASTIIRLAREAEEAAINAELVEDAKEADRLERPGRKLSPEEREAARAGLVRPQL